MKTIIEKANEYSNREDLYITQWNEYTSATIEQAFVAGYKEAESNAREKAVKAFNSALSMFAQGGISHYEAHLIFEDKYDNENS